MSDLTKLLDATALQFALARKGASAQGCDSLPLPSVTLKRFEVPATTNFEYGLTHIGAAQADGQKFVSGLTRGSAAAKAEFKAPGFVAQNGR